MKNEELFIPNECKKIGRKNKGVIFITLRIFGSFGFDYGGRVRFGIRKQYIHKRKTA